MGFGAVYLRYVRGAMPLVAGRYAGIEASMGKRLGDDLISRMARKPLGFDDDPDYEMGIVRGIRAFVRPADRIVVIGGGFGVTATLAAKQAGPAGKVTCFEGSAIQVAAVRDTARRNGVGVDVHHAFVGRNDQVYVSAEGAHEVPVADLPECDVLEMDCEGAELGIIRELRIRPRDILVETHGVHGSPTADVKAALVAIGYNIDPEKLPIGGANTTRLSADCDIYVLHAHRS